MGPLTPLVNKHEHLYTMPYLMEGVWIYYVVFAGGILVHFFWVL